MSDSNRIRRCLQLRPGRRHVKSTLHWWVCLRTIFPMITRTESYLAVSCGSYLNVQSKLSLTKLHLCVFVIFGLSAKLRKVGYCSVIQISKTVWFGKLISFWRRCTNWIMDQTVPESHVVTPVFRSAVSKKYTMQYNKCILNNPAILLYNYSPHYSTVSLFKR